MKKHTTIRSISLGIAFALLVSLVSTSAAEKAKPVALTKDNFDEKTKTGVVLVDFWAEWCGPCKAIAPVVEAIASEYDGRALIAKVDVDSEGDLAKKFQIRAIPNLKILVDGKVVDEIVGMASKEAIAAKLDAHLKKAE